MLSGALIQPGEIGKRRNLFSVLLVSAHGSVGKPERESRIWKTAGAFDGKARPGNFGIRLYLYFLLRIVSLAGLACRPVDQAREIEHRIVRSLQCGRVFGIELSPCGYIFEFRPRDELRRAGVRRFLRKHLLHERIAFAKLRREIRQRIGEEQYFVIVIDRFRGEEL